MANTFKNETYRSSKTLSYIAIGLLGSLILFAVCFFFLSFWQLASPDMTVDLDDGEAMPLPMMITGITALLRIPVFIATIVFFLIWEYRAFSNLSALKAQNLEFSPGWAVGWWFVPFANLVKPFQAMRELWNESDPEYDADLGFLSGSVGAPTIMGFWWAFWLLSNFADNITNRIEEPQAFSVVMIVASIFETIAAGLLIKIILEIVKRQELRFNRIGVLPQSAPPPPPVFDQPLQH